MSFDRLSSLILLKVTAFTDDHAKKYPQRWLPQCVDCCLPDGGPPLIDLTPEAPSAREWLFDKCDCVRTAHRNNKINALTFYIGCIVETGWV
jgi:hypothetical protein